jgi:hypothetical protein
MIESGLTSRLLADTTLAALIGTSIYPVLLPEGTSTAVTYRVISKVPDYSLTSALGMVKARIEFNAWAATYAAAKAIEEAIRLSLDGYAGALPNGVIVANILRDNGAIDGFDQDTRLYRVQIDYRVIYAE